MSLALMGDIILSHLEALDESEESNEGERKNWLKLSGRTKALIAIAIARCGKGSRISVERSFSGPSLRVEQV